MLSASGFDPVRVIIASTRISSTQISSTQSLQLKSLQLKSLPLNRSTIASTKSLLPKSLRPKSLLFESRLLAAKQTGLNIQIKRRGNLQRPPLPSNRTHHCIVRAKLRAATRSTRKPRFLANSANRSRSNRLAATHRRRHTTASHHSASALHLP